MRSLRLALAQFNPTVGDLRGNADQILAFADRASQLQADILVCPELALTGYPPEDLLFRPQFLRDTQAQLERVVSNSGAMVLVVGAPTLVGDGQHNPAAVPTPDHVQSALFNSAVVAWQGRVIANYHKIYLPNYGVFDEARYFQPGSTCPVFEILGVKVGVNVCEDIWYEFGPATVQSLAGAEVILNINASPYQNGKAGAREELIRKRAVDHGVHLAYTNLVGGQDELVFDGCTMVVDPRGTVLARAPQFEDCLLPIDIDVEDSRTQVGRLYGQGRDLSHIGIPDLVHVSSRVTELRKSPLAHDPLAEKLPELAEIYAALVTGTRDYVVKSGFKGALIGLSGGIDSALTAAIAVDALGSDSVTAFFMPSKFTSDQSDDDANRLASNLGIEMLTIPISSVFERYLSDLAPVFGGRPRDLTEENIQARIRGNLLMAASNKLGWIVLTTGNKSEMATGYATLYGDMAGGFAVIKDVPKTLVFRLANHRNTQAWWEIIPQAIIDRPPTAELREDQKDEDSLPPYDILDPILQAYVEDDWTVAQKLKAGMAPEAVRQAVSLVDRSEYKRRQAPPGVKITRRNFGRDRRLPLVNRYRPTSTD